MVRYLATVLVLVISFSGCGSDNSTEKNGALFWSEKLLDAVSANRLGPPMTARAIAIVHTCMYDAWAAYDEKALGTRLGGSLRRPSEERTTENKTRAVSYAAYRALTDLYPNDKPTFDAAMVELGFDPHDTSTDGTTPTGIGNLACNALLEFRHQDGANQLGDIVEGAYADYTGYQPVNSPDQVRDPSRWQQLRFANGQAPGFIAPHWQHVVPFALTAASQFRTPPPSFGSPQYLEEVQEIVDIYANLTDRQKAIAEYWADGPRTVLPPGHWVLFAQVISERDHHSLDQDVKMFFMVANAVFDAGIAAWDMKRHYDTSRPITVIRHLYSGQQISSFISPELGFGIVDGKDWLPYQSPNFITPPFSEYISGHSTFSAAAAEVLRRVTGSDRFDYGVTVPARSSQFDPSVPATAERLEWATFSEAADEAGISRRYGGIHFRSGDLVGRSVGRQVGEAVWNRAMRYLNGES